MVACHSQMQLVWQSEEMMSNQLGTDVVLARDEFELPSAGPSYFWKVSSAELQTTSCSCVIVAIVHQRMLVWQPQCYCRRTACYCSDQKLVGVTKVRE